MSILSCPSCLVRHTPRCGTKSTLVAWVSRSSPSVLCVIDSPDTQRIFGELRVSFSSHLVSLHDDLDRSIQYHQLLRAFREEPHVHGLFHLKTFLPVMTKDQLLLPSCHHAEVVSMALSFEFFILTATERKACNSNLQ